MISYIVKPVCNWRMLHVIWEWEDTQIHLKFLRDKHLWNGALGLFAICVLAVLVVTKSTAALYSQLNLAPYIIENYETQ